MKKEPTIYLITALMIIVGIAIVVQSRRPGPRIVPATVAEEAKKTPVRVAAEDSRERKPVTAATLAPTPDSNATAKAAGPEQVVDELKEYMQNLPLDEQDLLDWENVERLRDKYGSFTELYKVLDAEKRENLITMLWDKELLREELPNLLPLENNSDIRASIFAQVYPKGLWDEPTLEGEKPIDKELMAIMEAPTKSAIGREEWLRRLDVANLITEEYGLKWARDAAANSPNDPGIQTAAATTVLRNSQALDNPDPAETKKAEDYLKKMLGEDGGQKVTSDQRAQSYYALYYGTDKNATLATYRNQLGFENDDQNQRVLNDLIRMIERDLEQP